MSPIELLQKELDKHIKNVHKSNIAFAEGKISKEDNQMHFRNNEKIIVEYEIAIQILTTHI